MSTFRFIIVGSGNISGTYALAAEKVEEVEVVGVVSRGGRCPEGLEGVEVKPSLGEIEGEFDAVILATPNGLHHTGAIEAAGMGKHVLTEKPLDISMAAMDQMMDACREAGVTLAVCYQRRMSPDNRNLKRLLEEKALGRVYAADFSVKCYRDQGYYDSGAYRGGWEIDGGGPFIQQASHHVDLYCWFFGMPVEVRSMVDTFAHTIEAEDHGAAILRHEDGMIGSFIASTIAKPGFPPRVEIHAEKGSLVMENDVITLWEVEGVANPSKAPVGVIHSGAGSAAVKDTSGHEAILRDFVAAVREGRCPVAEAASARMATELILKIYGKT